jgi:hypothetical protein
MPHRRSCAVGLAAILVLVLAGLLASQSLAQKERPPVPLDAADVARLGGDLPGDPQVQLVQVASGLTNPVNIAFPPDDSGRLFVVEVGGTIRVVNPDGTVVEDRSLIFPRPSPCALGNRACWGWRFTRNLARTGGYMLPTTISTRTAP